MACVDPWGRRLVTETLSVVVDVTPPPPAAVTAPLPGTLVTTANAVVSGTGVPGAVVYGRSGDNQWTAFEPVVVGADGAWSGRLDATYLLVYGGQRLDDHVAIWQQDSVGNGSVIYWNLALDLRASTSYADVKPKATYAADVAWFSRAGLSLSSLSGLFSPDTAVNRADSHGTSIASRGANRSASNGRRSRTSIGTCNQTASHTTSPGTQPTGSPSSAHFPTGRRDSAGTRR